MRISACAYSQHGKRIQFGRSKQPGGMQLKARATVAARLRQPSGTRQPTGGPETPNRTPKAPDSPRLDVSCRARARGTDGFAGETALIFQLGVFFEEPMLDPKKAPASWDTR